MTEGERKEWLAGLKVGDAVGVVKPGAPAIRAAGHVSRRYDRFITVNWSSPQTCGSASVPEHSGASEGTRLEPATREEQQIITQRQWREGIYDKVHKATTDQLARIEAILSESAPAPAQGGEE